MTNGNADPMNDKVTLEIARELAIKGDYKEAVKLLSPLTKSQYSIEASNLLGKIYAQNQDFDTAEKYFNEVLKQDKNNAEAKNGLKKCGELKGSKLKTYFSFNKLKVYSIIAILVLVIGAAAIFSLTQNSTSGSMDFEETILADADIVNVTFEASADAQNLVSELNYLKSAGYPLSISSQGNSINVSTNPASLPDVLYVLNNANSNYTSVNFKSIVFSLSEDAKNSAVQEANDHIANDINFTNMKEVKNKSATVEPNTASFENGSDYSAQEAKINNMLSNDSYMKVKVKSVFEIVS